MFFDRVAILGVGLIGGSVGRALKERGLAGRVAGFGRKKGNLVKAIEMGCIDSYSLSPALACMDADLVILSSTVDSFAQIMKQAAPALKKGALVIDAGSVKASVIAELVPLIPAGVDFVPCHPIAGGERTGSDASDPALFDGALCIITPTKRNTKAQLSRARDLWKALGAKVQVMDASEHDRIYSHVSHMPHLAAYALVQAVGGPNPDTLKIAGKGFADSTRIALSSPEMWAGICMANRANVLADTDRLIKTLTDFSKRLRRDGKSLEAAFSKARDMRRRLG